jgi:hypothetical protein
LGDPLGEQRLAYGRGARTTTLERLLGQGSGERVVVDEPHPLEAVEDLPHLDLVEPGLPESPLELPAAPWAHREEAERAFVTALRGRGTA